MPFAEDFRAAGLLTDSPAFSICDKSCRQVRENHGHFFLKDFEAFDILVASILMTPQSIAKLRPAKQRANLFAGD